MAKSEFLQIRLSPSDRQRVLAVAEANYLDPSTWARQALLRAVEQWEAENKVTPGQAPAGRHKRKE